MKKNVALSLILVSSVGICFAEDMHPESKRVVSAIKKELDELKREIKTPNKNGDKKSHPCVAFSDGGKDASWSATMILGLAKMLTGNEWSVHDLGVVALPFSHSLMHHEANGLSHPFVSWLSSNWTTLGLSALVTAYCKSHNCSSKEAFNAVVTAIYVQYAAAIGAARLEVEDML